MPTIYFLKKADMPENEKHLAERYIEKKVAPDAYLVGLFIQIIDEMKLFVLDNGKINNLKWDKKIGFHYALIAKDRLGQNRSRIIIKKLIREQHSYEIRIDEEHINHRILFFCSNEINEETNTEFFVLSFGFEKQKFNTLDMTDILSKSTSEIKRNIDTSHSREEILNYWLGGERNGL